MLNFFLSISLQDIHPCFKVEQQQVIDYTTEMNKESLKKDTDLFDDYSLEPSLVEGNSDEEGVSVSEQKDYVKLVSEDDEDYEETDATQQRDKVLWIPYNSEEDIEDYQNNFSPKFAFNADATEAEVRIQKLTKTFSSRLYDIGTSKYVF